MFKKFVLAVSLIAICSVFMASAAPAFAQPKEMGGQWSFRGGMHQGPHNAIFGKVTAVNGNTLTVTDSRGKTTYTVDATNATITKNGATAIISDVAVGDTIMVQGTINDTNVTATAIRDGQPMNDRSKTNHNAAQTPVIQGDGQPVIAGTVTTISGTTITITNKNNVVYTIDASNAKIEKGRTSASVSDITAGDKIIAQGAINGTSVVATSIIDQTKPASTPATDASTSETQRTAGHPFGFFGNIFNFLKRFFGF